VSYWIGRYLGIPSVLRILASSAYSLRKLTIISSGKPVTLLRLHERLAWAGSLLFLALLGAIGARAGGNVHASLFRLISAKPQKSVGLVPTIGLTS